MVEMGTQKEWISTTEVYQRIYVKLGENGGVLIEPLIIEDFNCEINICARCGKKLLPEIWYIQINKRTYCSEECVLAEYDWLEPYFKEK